MPAKRNPRTKPKRYACLACCAMAFDSTAGHACSATAPDVFSVGNKAADASCNYGSIQEAITAAICPAGTKIMLNQGGDYTNQHLTITDKNITLVGRASAPHCNTLEAVCGVPPLFLTCPVGPLQTIDGGRAQHPGGGPVLQVRGISNVTISHLVLSGGDGTDGGGIDFSGSGSLDLDNSTVSDNHATNGAGINLQSNGGTATLNIGQSTTVEDNIAAADGGGIRIDDAHLNMNSSSTWITGNHAAGYGGGIDISGGTANIGSGGYLLGAVIYLNQAKYGGGIAVGDANDFISQLNLYTTDPLHPVAIDNNTASLKGGGIYSDGEVCAANFRLTYNSSQEGSALNAANTSATYLNPDANNTSCHLAELGSVPCTASQQCSIVHNNSAPGTGAALRVSSGAYLVADRLDVRANQDGYALHVEGNAATPQQPTHVELSNCLFAENVLAHELMLAETGTSDVTLKNCTLARDSIGAAQVIASNDVLSVDDTILAEGSIVAAAPAVIGNYNLAENITGLNGLVSSGTPAFIDAEHGDYRLYYGIRGGQLLRSPGIDHAPPDASIPADIREGPRDQQVSASAAYGPRDLGAYEMQGVTDRIFIDTFGDDQLLVQ